MSSYFTGRNFSQFFAGNTPHPYPPAASKDSNEALAYTLFNKWLAEVEKLLEKEERLLLLAFDEFEKLEEAGERGFIDLALLLDWFREIIQYHPRLILLFSGVRTLDEMGGKTRLRWSSYFINVRTLHIGLLHKQEAEQLITQPVKNYPADEIYGPNVVDEIINQTGCQPFLIQAVCSTLIDNMNTERRAMARVRDVERAVERVLTEWDAYFDELWSRTDEPQRLILKALQETRTEENQHPSIGPNHQNDPTQRHALQMLLRRDLIIQNDDGTYRIASPMFGQWLERNWHRGETGAGEEATIVSGHLGLARLLIRWVIGDEAVRG